MKKILITCFFTLSIATSGFTQIIENNNNVGIGVTPQYKLDVNGTIFSRGTLTSSVSNPEIGGAVEIVNPNKTAPGAAMNWVIYNMSGSYGNSLQFWAYDQTSCNGGLCEARLVLTDHGNVGIGVRFPAAKLSVNGGIVATKIKVNQQLAWPDYVFEPSYSLPSLYALEQYIQKNKHLPDVPSAETVAKDGIDLGDNQVVLLKKIEELTLYVIELKKEVDALKKQK